MPQDLVLLYGRPGVGKFTIGRALAERTGYRLVHNHGVVDLASALFPFGSAPFIALREQLWLEVVAAGLVAGLPGLILTFVPERTVTEDFLPALQERVARHGARFRSIELRCAPGTLATRLTAPDRAAFGKIRDPAFYRELEESGAFDRPRMPPPELSLAVDELAPDDAARRIADELRAS
jgi:hypothetical protein